MYYIYAYRLRGFSLGCQPRGHVYWNDNGFRWGVVVYDRQLTDNEVDSYELELVAMSEGRDN